MSPRARLSILTWIIGKLRLGSSPHRPLSAAEQQQGLTPGAAPFSRQMKQSQRDTGEIIGGDGAEELPITGPQPLAGGDSAFPGSAAGWECPNSAVCSAAQRFSRITVLCSKQIIQKAAVSCFTLGQGAETLRRCSSAASLSQLHPSIPRAAQAEPGSSGLWLCSPHTDTKVDRTLVGGRLLFTLPLRQDSEARPRRCWTSSTEPTTTDLGQDGAEEDQEQEG